MAPLVRTPTLSDAGETRLTIRNTLCGQQGQNATTRFSMVREKNPLNEKPCLKYKHYCKNDFCQVRFIPRDKGYFTYIPFLLKTKRLNSLLPRHMFSHAHYFLMPTGMWACKSPKHRKRRSFSHLCPEIFHLRPHCPWEPVYEAWMATAMLPL